MGYFQEKKVTKFMGEKFPREKRQTSYDALKIAQIAFTIEKSTVSRWEKLWLFSKRKNTVTSTCERGLPFPREKRAAR
jgi:hypothetical protein